MSIERYLAQLNTEPKSDGNIESVPIQKLIGPITKIIEEMESSIENGEYALVVGDDASGRIPTLILSEIINSVYKTDKRQKIDTRFLALYPSWKYHESWRQLTGEEEINPELLAKRSNYAKEKIRDEFVDKIDRERMGQKKILIVTELLSSGSALKPLTNALTEAGITFDIACIAAFVPKKKLKEMGTAADKFFVGGDEMPSIYERPNISGVIKDSANFNLKSLPSKQLSEPEHQASAQNQINKAREDAHKVANQVLESVWGKK